MRADAPIPGSADDVIALAESKVRRSPLFDRARSYPVYVCNARWRWRYFSFFDGRSRGFETALGRAVFLREARWAENQLAGPDGRDGPRPLDVYIAHEVTHMMVEDRIGAIASRRLPAWLREGYAEYVARSHTFDYATARAQLIAGEAPPRDAYWKYLLLVSHLLDVEGRDPLELLAAPPDMREVEEHVRSRLTTP
ncbi:MAG: hypothetical protein JNK04_13170 [Myxococcales bacterium]|nr:hypothetical protein [Myxococcales bacterium]